MPTEPGEEVCYTARVVFPVAGPPLPNGILTVRGGRIVAVEPRGARTADLDLGNVALVPGLVNAHTHLDLSGARGLVPPSDAAHFTDWLRGVIAYRRGRTPEQVSADTRAGLAEALRFGTTLLGDISADGASWDALAGAPTRAVVFRELIGLSEERAAAALAAAKQWYASRAETADLRAGAVDLDAGEPALLGEFELRLGVSGRLNHAVLHGLLQPGPLGLLGGGGGGRAHDGRGDGSRHPQELQTADRAGHGVVLRRRVAAASGHRPTRATTWGRPSWCAEG